MSEWLSPEAAKAQREGQARASLWQPTLLRTSSKLIVQHATNNRRGQSQGTARTMLSLDGWQWDDERAWFWTELNAESLEAVLDAWSTGAYLYLNISTGVQEYIEQQESAA